MLINVQVWTIPRPDDEEPCEDEIIAGCDFPATSEGMEDAKNWAWARLEEGFFVRMFRG